MITTLLLAAAAVSAPVGAASPWKAVATSGAVDSRASGAVVSDWRKLVRGDGLAASSDVRTGRRGRATLTDRASILMIDPASEVHLPPEGAAPRVVQAKGSVVYEVDGSKVQGFEVVTPFLVAGVKGTVFLVTVHERRAAVSVERGVVSVRREGSDDTIDVHAGETAVFDADTSHGIQLIREEAKGSGSASEFAEREQRKLDDRRAEATGVLGLDLHADDALAAAADGLDRTTDALADGAASLLDRDAGMIGDVVDTIVDPVSDVLGPVLDPQSDPTGGGILDPLSHLLQELSRGRP